MNVKVLRSDLSSISNDSIDLKFKEDKFRKNLVCQVVNADFAAKRQGTKKQLSRSEVRGGGRKPWKQKGTGRARAGSSRSPIWVGGGVTFAAVPRNYKQKVNVKMRRQALFSVISEMFKQNRILLTEKLVVQDHKTKSAKILLKNIQSQYKANKILFISSDFSKDFILATRNLFNVNLLDSNKILLSDLINSDLVVMDIDSLKKLEERLS